MDTRYKVMLWDGHIPIRTWHNRTTAQVQLILRAYRQKPDLHLSIESLPRKDVARTDDDLRTA